MREVYVMTIFGEQTSQVKVLRFEGAELVTATLILSITAMTMTTL
jgi:hypothetical protein